MAAELGWLCMHGLVFIAMRGSYSHFAPNAPNVVCFQLRCSTHCSLRAVAAALLMKTEPSASQRRSQFASAAHFAVEPSGAQRGLSGAERPTTGSARKCQTESSRALLAR